LGRSIRYVARVVIVIGGTILLLLVKLALPSIFRVVRPFNLFANLTPFYYVSVPFLRSRDSSLKPGKVILSIDCDTYAFNLLVPEFGI
jgi:hypothetical protein